MVSNSLRSSQRFAPKGRGQVAGGASLRTARSEITLQPRRGDLIPQVAFFVLDAMLLEQRQQLDFEVLFTVMLLLVSNVAFHAWRLGLADRERCVPFLPAKFSQSLLFIRPFRGIRFQHAQEVVDGEGRLELYQQ